MARIFITGSTTGLGLIAARQLLGRGHEVILHARNGARARDLEAALGFRPFVAVGDLGSIRETLGVAQQVAGFGAVDSVIHNAGVGYGGDRAVTDDGYPDIFAVNVLAPYLLTASVPGPNRLVYLSSGMHRVTPDFADLLWRKRRWNGALAYSESKFLVTALALAVARLQVVTYSNAVDPGWVPTRMGGRNAPDDLDEGAVTQVCLAEGAPADLASLTGRYLHHLRATEPHPQAKNQVLQDQLLRFCAELTGVTLGADSAG